MLTDATPLVAANHSRRTYAWAAALAARDGRSYDKEVVYVASLLHDLYLARPDEPERPHCFTLPAADDALSLARRCGNPGPRLAFLTGLPGADWFMRRTPSPE